MNVGERMRVIRKQKQMSADELARKIGVSRSTIFRYEKGDIEKVPIEIVAKVADALDIKPEQLMGLKPASIADSVHNIVTRLHPARQEKVYNYADNQLKEQQNENVVQFSNTREVVSGRETAAGLPINGENQDSQASHSRVNVEDIPSGTDEIITVAGDSMEPDYPKYSQIFVHWQPVIENGDLAVVRVEDEGVTFKKVFIDGKKKCITLHSLNPEYPDRSFYDGEISIIGRVLN